SMGKTANFVEKLVNCVSGSKGFGDATGVDTKTIFSSRSLSEPSARRSSPSFAIAPEPKARNTTTTNQRRVTCNLLLESGFHRLVRRRCQRPGERSTAKNLAGRLRLGKRSGLSPSDEKP